MKLATFRQIWRFLKKLTSFVRFSKKIDFLDYQCQNTFLASKPIKSPDFMTFFWKKNYLIWKNFLEIPCGSSNIWFSQSETIRCSRKQNSTNQVRYNFLNTFLAPNKRMSVNLPKKCSNKTVRIYYYTEWMQRQT